MRFDAPTCYRVLQLSDVQALYIEPSSPTSTYKSCSDRKQSQVCASSLLLKFDQWTVCVYLLQIANKPTCVKIAIASHKCATSLSVWVFVVQLRLRLKLELTEPHYCLSFLLPPLH